MVSYWKPVVALMMRRAGERREITMRPTTISPKTASLFLKSRRHASFQSDVPATAECGSSSVRTSPSPTAISGKA